MKVLCEGCGPAVCKLESDQAPRYCLFDGTRADWQEITTEGDDWYEGVDRAMLEEEIRESRRELVRGE